MFPCPFGFSRTRWLLPLGAVLLLTACSEAETDETEAGPPAPRVTVMTTELQQVEDVERSLGRLRARADTTISAEVEGRLIEIRVSEGDEVELGEELAVIDPLDFELQLSQARAEIGQLTAEIETKEAEVDRQRQLREGGHVPEAVMQQTESDLVSLEQSLIMARARLASSQLNRDRSTILAPFAGRVDVRHVSEGEYMSPGQEMFRIVRGDRLEVEMPFPERLSERLEVGQAVRLYGNGADEATVETEVSSLLPTVGAESRAIVALAELSNPGDWRPGGSVHAEVVLEMRESVVVPGQAVVLRPDGDVVYVEEEGVAVETPVVLGRRTASWVELREGVEPGQRVIIDGAGFLADGVVVEAQPASDDMLPDPTGDDAETPDAAESEG